MRAAQLIAGHTDPSVTARYTRVDQDRLGRVVNLIDYERAKAAVN